MIIYRNTKGGFINDVRDNIIADKIVEAFAVQGLAKRSESEVRSWANSLQFMRNAIDDHEIDDSCDIAIEYQVPLTSKRVDFLIAGVDSNHHNNIIVVELKQWEDSGKTSRADIVTAFVGGNTRAVTHPSYQAYSYAKIIENFNEEVSKHDIHLYPCAYLHNYKEQNRPNIDCTLYRTAIELAPVFLHNDTAKLRNFIKHYIHQKDGIDLLMKIENGKLKPAKALQDSLVSMLQGNTEFYLIDEQKVTYETIKRLVANCLKVNNRDKKFTVIVEGGPGTGKSVVAIQLLCNLIQQGFSANYVTKNSAPRNVYFAKLRGQNYKASYISNLFRGSGSYVDSPKNCFDCLIADEAHRLQMKSGMFQNLGEAQIKEIIHASRVSVFFIDEKQVVTTSDVGSIELIKRYAAQEGSMVIAGSEYNLTSQFRCNGSDGYLAFLDQVLYNQGDATSFEIDYDIQLFNDACAMREALRKKNALNNKSRMLAGYCYNWQSKNDLSKIDIVLPGGFAAQWNFANTATFAIDENSFEQVGCIHTSQGLEFDYVGVIIGKDLIYKDGKVLTDYTQRARTDTSLKGIKTTHNYELADRIIRNTYRTLLSRGQKGCYVYCEDHALYDYFSKILAIIKNK